MPDSVFGKAAASPIVLLGGIVLLALCYPIAVAIYNIYFHPLSSYPGPKLGAATRLWSTYSTLSGTLSYDVLRLHEKYGDVVRIGPAELSYINAEGWKDIYGHRSGKPEMTKDPIFYGGLSSGSLSILGATRDRHAHIRRQLAHGFSDMALREQEVEIQKYADLLMRRLYENAKGGKDPVNMVSWYNYFTFDLIGDLAFGEPFGCLESSLYHPWVIMIFDTVKSGAWMRSLQHYPILAKVMQYFVPKEMVARRKAHLELTRIKSLRRIETKTDRTDFFSRMTQEDSGVSVPEFIATAVTLIIAGSETTATLLSAVTFHLLTNPSKMAILVKEIRSTFAEEKDISLLNVNHLKYMLACLDESLRLFPPVPGALPRTVPPGGDIINGRVVPEKTVVSVMHMPAYRSSRNFALPTEWHPERWLGDPRFSGDNKAVFQPFSVGPRNCVGRNLAYLEMRLVLARMLFNFDLELVDGQDSWDDQRSYGIWEKKPLWVRLRPVDRGASEKV